MRYTTTLLLTAAVGAFAQSEKISDNIPECSVKCINDGLASVSDCATDDALCYCFPDTYYATYDAAVACVLQACGNDKAVGEVLPAITSLCGRISPEWQVEDGEGEGDETTTPTTTTTPAPSSPAADPTEKLSSVVSSASAAASSATSSAPPAASSEPADSAAGRAVVGVAAGAVAFAALLL